MGNGKEYRLKCDCCRGKRAETQYDFHPCQIERCTFSICWSCLQRWKDQSDKDVTKKFDCPQCHTEYDTKFIEEHKQLSKEIIKRVNEEAKIKRKIKKKRRKKRDQNANKQKLSEQQKNLRQRLENKNKKNKSTP